MNPRLDKHSIILAFPTPRPVVRDCKLRVPARPAGGRDLLRQLTTPIGSPQDAVHWVLGLIF